jgi:sterol desaturase/sphingolipid hydroxylase (fatty acid hydroxylase superfamily)
MLGVYAIAIFGFGYLELSKWMEQYSTAASTVMYISAVIFLLLIVVHHVICGLVEWFYIKLGRTEEARNVVLEFQTKTITTMVIGYLGLAVFVVALFLMVVSGKTSLPQWACIFNTLPFMVVLTPTKLPAKGNMAGAMMFIGLLILI